MCCRSVKVLKPCFCPSRRVLLLLIISLRTSITQLNLNSPQLTIGLCKMKTSFLTLRNTSPIAFLFGQRADAHQPNQVKEPNYPIVSRDAPPKVSLVTTICWPTTVCSSPGYTLTPTKEAETTTVKTRQEECGKIFQPCGQGSDCCSNFCVSGLHI